jgi:hypothetical protein
MMGMRIYNSRSLGGEGEDSRLRGRTEKRVRQELRERI